jgi:hypothetical protein
MPPPRRVAAPSFRHRAGAVVGQWHRKRSPDPQVGALSSLSSCTCVEFWPEQPSRRSRGSPEAVRRERAQPGPVTRLFAHATIDGPSDTGERERSPMQAAIVTP